MSKSPNTNAQLIDVQIGTSETEIPHNLGRVAKDGIVIRRTEAGHVFRGATAWDGTNIYLQSDVTMGIRFYVF